MDLRDDAFQFSSVSTYKLMVTSVNHHTEAIPVRIIEVQNGGRFIWVSEPNHGQILIQTLVVARDFRQRQNRSEQKSPILLGNHHALSHLKVTRKNDAGDRILPR